MDYRLWFRRLNFVVITFSFLVLVYLFLMSPKAKAADYYGVDLRQDRSQSRVTETLEWVRMLTSQKQFGVTSATAISAHFYPAYSSSVNLNTKFVGYWLMAISGDKVFVGIEQSAELSVLIIERGQSLWLPKSDPRYFYVVSYLEKKLGQPLQQLPFKLSCARVY